MIISCEKCNKKFEVPESAIPENGRILQCGSCSHKWHYTKSEKKLDTDLVENKVANDEKFIKKENILKEDKKTNKDKKSLENNYEINNPEENQVSFFNYLLVVIISLISFIILIDTFKIQISYIYPDIELHINQLYETLRDIFLFFKDLLK